MPRQVSQALLLQTGLYPPKVVANYARARRYQPRLSIQTFVKMYEATESIADSLENSADYCPRVLGIDEKLEVHKSIMQKIAVDTLASDLNQKTRRQCADYMRSTDMLHVRLTTKIKDHPLCPNTMDFYSQVLGKSNPIQFHGQLVNGIVAAIQDGWDQFSAPSQEWSFLSADKFRKFFSKRVKQFTNLEESIESTFEHREPGFEPISEPSLRSMPGSVAIEDAYYSDDDDYGYYEEPVNAGYSSDDLSSDIDSEEYSSDGVIEVASVLADTKKARSLKPYEPVESHDTTPVLRHVAKDRGYRPDLVPISDLMEEQKQSSEMRSQQTLEPIKERTTVASRSKLVPIAEEPVTKLRPKLVPISEQQQPRARSKLVPINDQRAKPTAVREQRRETPKDRLGGEILPPSTARRPNLTAIGAEKVSKTRQSTLKPYEPEKPVASRPKLVPFDEASPSVRARPKLVPMAEPVGSSAKPTVKRPMPQLISNDQEETKFDSVGLSLRWLESYLDTNGPSLSDELVFFAPTNAKSQQIISTAESRGKKPAVKPIVECHLCEHSGTVDMATLTTVGGHEIQMGRRGKIMQPKVRSEWANYVGTKDVSGFTVHVYAQGNVFKH